MTFYNFAHGYHYDSNYYVDDKRVAYGPDDNLRNHQWVSNFIYELPFGKGKAYAGGVGRAADDRDWRLADYRNRELGRRSAVDPRSFRARFATWKMILAFAVQTRDPVPSTPERGASSTTIQATIVQFFNPLVDASGNSLL